MTALSHHRAAGVLAVAVTTAIWGASSVLIKSVALPPLSLALVRLAMGIPMLLGLLRLRGSRLTWPMVRVALPGGLFFATNLVLYFAALQRTSVADATLITSLQPPLILLVAGPFFGEVVTFVQVRWTIVACSGVALFVFGSARLPIWDAIGDLYAVLALVAWIGYFVASKRARRTVRSLEYISGIAVVAAVVAAVPALVSSRPLLPHRAIDWLSIAVIAAVPGIAGHTLLAWAHRYVEGTVTSLILIGVPVVAAISALVVLGEPIGVVQASGGVVVLGALAAIVATSRQDEPVPVPPE